jgi:hypothetical protein
MSTPADAPEPPRKFFSPLGILFDFFLTGCFFLFMTWICYGHNLDVPPVWKWGLAAFTAAGISGIFWLVLQGFRVAVLDHCRRKKLTAPSS